MQLVKKSSILSSVITSHLAKILKALKCGEYYRDCFIIKLNVPIDFSNVGKSDDAEHLGTFFHEYFHFPRNETAENIILDFLPLPFLLQAVLPALQGGVPAGALGM